MDEIINPGGAEGDSIYDLNDKEFIAQILGCWKASTPREVLSMITRPHPMSGLQIFYQLGAPEVVAFVEQCRILAAE